MLDKIGRAIDRASYSVLWHIFRKTGPDGEVVFYAHYPLSYKMFEPIHSLIPNTRIVVSPQNGGVSSVLSDMKVQHSTRRGYPKIVICADFPDGFYPKTTGIKFLHIMHGVADKNYAYDKELNSHVDFHIVPGPHIREMLISKAGVEPERIRVVGFPKLDSLFNGTLDRSAILEELGLDPNRKTILYAPTTRDEFNSLLLVAQHLNRIARKYNVLVKLHPGYDPRYSDQGLPWIKLFQGTSNVHLTPFQDAVPYMYASDLLIADAGSIMFEFSALQRPIVLVDVPTKYRGMGGFDGDGIEQRWRDIGVRVRDPLDLPKAIEQAFATHNLFRDRQKEYAQRLFYKLDGNSSVRAAEAISSISLGL